MTITINEMNNQVEKIALLRAKEAEASQIKKTISDELALEEGKMLEMLTQSDMTSYRSPVGSVSISHRTSVKTPKTPESREKFFSYLKSRGLYDTMISVNSQTLNSFYKEEFEIAKERGDIDFSIPGLDEISINQILSFRR